MQQAAAVIAVEVVKEAVHLHVPEHVRVAVAEVAVAPARDAAWVNAMVHVCHPVTEARDD